MEAFDLMERCFIDEDALEDLALHVNWRVRYAAAVAMGETKNSRWLPVLKEMLSREEARSLYSQQPAQFTNSTDDTRMAEEIGPITVAFEITPLDATLEDWRCRGRVKQAVFFAVYEISAVDEEFLEMIHQTIERAGEDFPVKTAAVRTLRKVGGEQSIRYLHMAERLDEWCTQTEARKALRELIDDSSV